MRGTFTRADLGGVTWLGDPAVWAPLPIETHEHAPWHPPLRLCEPGIQARCAVCGFRAGLCTGSPVDVKAIVSGTWICRNHRGGNDAA